ncbi:hypothetical protein, partial [Arthrobacter sp. CAN_A214]|uniref:hypothetical protein n=1 Tax=Arthrobacter sp. CAN_A214 TaxID=2787720 RepID=UPI0018CBE66B
AETVLTVHTRRAETVLTVHTRRAETVLTVHTRRAETVLTVHTGRAESRLDDTALFCSSTFHDAGERPCSLNGTRTVAKAAGRSETGPHAGSGPVAQFDPSAETGAEARHADTDPGATSR